MRLKHFEYTFNRLSREDLFLPACMGAGFDVGQFKVDFVGQFVQLPWVTGNVNAFYAFDQ